MEKENTEKRRGQYLPSDIPILPLRDMVAFPYSLIPLRVGIPRSVKLIEKTLEGDRIIGLVAMKDSSIELPQPGQIYEIGTIAKVERVVRGEDNDLTVVVHGLERFQIDHWLGSEPFLRAHAVSMPENVEKNVELDALHRSLLGLAQEVFSLSPNLPREAAALLNQLDQPLYLAYLAAGSARLEVDEGQRILEARNVKDKLRILISHFSHEKEVLNLGKKIESEAREEIDKAQKEYYLREQLKAIRKELGETEESASVSDEYMEKLGEADLPEEAMKEAKRELKRLGNMSPHSPEYTVIRTYLDWVVDLPWRKASEDQSDMGYARQVLDEDHYDLQEVKERIIEYLAVRNLVRERGGSNAKGNAQSSAQKSDGRAPESMGAILCFVGPPGVGKTSLGQSIARSLGRTFTRMSLGGMRDEAEIRGHRRTYIGAMPGRIIQAIKRAGTRNPVFMLDEVDKIGNDWRGDPSSALLEVLDPAQNHAFRDHYLDLDFDLSDVIFITTANQLGTIPAPLRDRMEILHLDGYTEHEKIQIAQRHLVLRQLKANGLYENEITFTEEALRKVVRDYTREAGVRNLERQIGAICRKAVVRIAGEEFRHVEVTPELVREYLKKELFESESSEEIDIPGIATGLAVTEFGGDILFVEATRMPGKGHLTLTGQLGDVMRESARIAHSYVRSKAEQLHIDASQFQDTDVHIHVPAGAIPKDGPSAGVAMVLATASLFTCRPVHSNIAMTGELTLRGRVLPVGGIKMKVLAAHRAGLKTVILPKRNEKDLDELPDEVRESMKFVLVDRIDEALEESLSSEESGRGMPRAVNC